MESELEQVASVEKRVREAITLPSKTDTQVEAGTPEFQSSAEGEDAQIAGKVADNSGTIPGEVGMVVQNLGMVAAKIITLSSTVLLMKVKLLIYQTITNCRSYSVR